ncbi:sigma-70 family RNA polymerase sigma factor [Cupriavidus necator]|uniref:Sigma-70 family RNA polymerase sigma factor n=1 Tax=Cupriavidus necator TaxID=106590 RepID=A0A1U9UKF8_CUPNE|nr:sigma-70 family RNA polymerase sigma factor [Cupriavidus necator]AQV92665.1 sigma-70 family RNA polymerase sigma factor [Cupriavidus necator]
MRQALETDDRLSSAEVKLELDNLSPADWVRVERLARRIFSGVAHASHEDILHEACVKLLSGERIWHRGYAAIPAIVSVLESMASNHRKREKNGPIDPNAAVATAEPMEDESVLVRQVEPVNSITPEMAVSDGQQLTMLDALLADDVEAMLVAYEWAAGRRGREAAEELGMSVNQYEAARKRLVRKLESMEDERRQG